MSVNINAFLPCTGDLHIRSQCTIYITYYVYHTNLFCRYNGAPCFIGKFLPSASSCKVLPIERPESNTNIDIHTAKELVKKLTIRNGKKCFKIYEQEYEDKANMIKGLMFSNDASEGWELEEPPENWCSTSEIAERLTTDLMQSFEQEYLSQSKFILKIFDSIYIATNFYRIIDSF